MTPEAKDHLNQLANQLHKFGHKTDCGHLAFQSYIHKGKRYCYPHYAALKQVNH